MLLKLEYLRYGVERDEFGAGLVRLWHGAEHLSGGYERLTDVVYVFLVDFVGAQDQFVLEAEGDEVTDVLLAETLSRGVAWVNEDQGARQDSSGLGLIQ